MDEADVERFLSKVSTEPDENGCLIWLTGRFESGYGQFWLKGKNVKAHRIAWEIEHGPIYDGLLVLHKCDVKWCVNVQHLYLGTAQDNVIDRIMRGGQAYGERHHNSIISDREAAEILYLALEGQLTQREIADIYGVCLRRVEDIRGGRAWRHIKPIAPPPPPPCEPLSRRSF
jgi:hypothetical protein